MSQNTTTAFSTQNYTFSLFLVFSRLQREFLLLKLNMPNRCVVYALSTHAFFDATSGNNLDREKVHKGELFEQDVLHFFLRRILRIRIS